MMGRPDPATRWRVAAGLALAVLAAPGWAQTRPAPDYFIAAAAALQAANTVAAGCPDLALDAGTIRSDTADVMARLEGDGFDITRADAGMEVSAEAMEAAQAAFRDRHGLAAEGADAAALCAAGTAEIAEGSRIGGYLRAAE